MSPRAGPYGALAVIGAAWGLTIPLTRLAVTEGHSPLGLLAWQTLLMTAILSILILLRRGRFVLTRPALGLYLVIALVGTLIPNAASFHAAAHLPAGILSILIAAVPMFALPIAILLGLETPQLARLSGVLLGLLAIVLIAGPEASLPGSTDAIWVAVTLIGPVCYGIEGNYLALRGRGGLDPFEVLWGASVLGAAIAVPVALATDSWMPVPQVWSAADRVVPVIALLHAGAYTGYVWLVGRAGSVFASQVAYVVTAMGVLWSMLLLAESYALWVWVAFALMLAGVAMVRPRDAEMREAA